MIKKENVISQGAEAKIILEDNKIIKKRVEKKYRHPNLDNLIRKRRNKSEFKLLEKASEIINSPNPLKLNKDDFSIEMPYLDGERLTDCLDSFEIKKQKKLIKEIGTQIAKLHEKGIIHGDLTTSNIILVEDQLKIIDFGLGYISKKIESKAVDIHLFKQALESKHFKKCEELYNSFIEGYSNYNDSKKILERLKAIEKRGRYRH